MSKKKKTPKQALSVETLFVQMTINANGMSAWKSLCHIATSNHLNVSDCFFRLSETSQHLVLDELLEERDGIDSPEELDK